MRFRRNIIPLGSGEICSVRASGDEVTFYQVASGVVIKRTYNFGTHRLGTDKKATAYAPAYLQLSNGSVRDIGEIIYTKT